MAAFAAIDLAPGGRHFGAEFVPALQVPLAKLALLVGFIAGAHAEYPPFHLDSGGEHFQRFANRRRLVWLGESHHTYVNLSVPLTD